MHSKTIISCTFVSILLSFLFCGCSRVSQHAMFKNLTPEDIVQQSTLIVYGEEISRETVIYDINSNTQTSQNSNEFLVITVKVKKIIQGEYSDSELTFYSLTSSINADDFGKSIFFLTQYKELDDNDRKALSTDWVPVLPEGGIIKMVNGKWIMRYDWKDYLARKGVLNDSTNYQTSKSNNGDYIEFQQDDLVDKLAKK